MPKRKITETTEEREARLKTDRLGRAASRNTPGKAGEILSISNKMNILPTELRGIGIQISRLEKQNKPPNSKFLTNFLKTDTSKTTIKSKEIQTSINDSKIHNTTNDIEAKINNTNNNDNVLTIATEKETHNDTKMNRLIDSKEKNQIKNMFNSLPKPSTSIQGTPRELSPVSEVAQYLAKTESVNNSITGNINTRGRGRGSGVVHNISKIGKTRGRPKGVGNKNTNKKNIKSGIRLDGFLKQQNNSKTIQRSITPIDFQQTDIDMDVLAALPEDIREEILKEYQLQKPKNILNKSPNNQPINVINKNSIQNKSTPTKTTTPQKIEQTPQKIITEDLNMQNEESNSSESSKTSEQPMFLGMNFSEVRELLRVWVSSEQTPEICDITMLADYFRKLALDMKIEDLFVMLKYFYNEVSKQESCDWHQAYYEVVNITQQGMIAKYGSAIYVYKDFQCEEKCHLQIT